MSSDDTDRPRRWEPWVNAAALVLTALASAFVTIWWANHQFHQERKHVPRGKVEVKVTHLPITDKGMRVLRARVEVTNAGVPQLPVYGVLTQLRQVLPLQPCTTDRVINTRSSTDAQKAASADEAEGDCVAVELAKSVAQAERCTDYFRWPLMAVRWASIHSPQTIEPQETLPFEMEFAVAPDVRSVLLFTEIIVTHEEFERVVRRYQDERTVTEGVLTLTSGACNHPPVPSTSPGSVTHAPSAGWSPRLGTPSAERNVSTERAPQAYRLWTPYDF